MKNGFRVAVLLILLASLVLKIFFAFYTPLYIDDPKGKIHALNDEYAHFKYVRYLAIHHSLPVNTHIRSLEDPVAWIFQDFEYAQPPLYYLLNVPLMALGSRALVACRLFSIFLSTLTLWLAICSAGIVFRKKDVAVLLTTVALGFHPILLRIGSAVSNDNLAWLLSSVLFYRLLKDGGEIRNRWVFGIIIGLGVLTKTSFLMWPVFLCLRAVLRFYRSRQLQSLERMPLRDWKSPVVVTLIALAISFWFFIYSQRTYGDATGITGGSGAPWSFLSSYSPVAVNFFVDSAMRFLYFPIAEEPVFLISVVQWFVVVIVIAFFLRNQETRLEFSDERQYRDCLLFTLVNLFFFFYANLFRNFAETRHLFIGLIPLTAIALAVLIQLFGRFSLLIAGAMNVLYLASRW
jgi:4-amino-4-deoxy-L-arabinose transferase-like glycosyltransferase